MVSAALFCRLEPRRISRLRIEIRAPLWHVAPAVVLAQMNSEESYAALAQVGLCCRLRPVASDVDSGVHQNVHQMSAAPTMLQRAGGEYQPDRNASRCARLIGLGRHSRSSPTAAGTALAGEPRSSACLGREDKTYSAEDSVPAYNGCTARLRRKKRAEGSQAGSKA